MRHPPLSFAVLLVLIFCAAARADGQTPPVAGSAVRSDSPKIAYVNVQTVASQSILGKQFRARVEDLTNKKGSPAAIAKLQGDLQAEFQEKLLAMLKQLGKERGLQLIFSAVDAGIAWADETVPDLSYEAIRRMDAAGTAAPAVSEPEAIKQEIERIRGGEHAAMPAPQVEAVSTPELHSDEAIEGDPLPPGQVWAVSPGSAETGPGLYRIEVTSGPGGGVKILNQPTPPAFRESVRVGEQNLYTRSKELVGDRDPREHEFSIQMRAIDADKSGTGLGLPILVALCGSLLGRNTRGGTIVVGSLNLGGSIEMVPNPVRIAELAVDKQAQTLLMPVACRRLLAELPDDMWTRISIEFYKDSGDAVFKALVE